MIVQSEIRVHYRLPYGRDRLVGMVPHKTEKSAKAYMENISPRCSEQGGKFRITQVAISDRGFEFKRRVLYTTNFLWLPDLDRSPELINQKQ